ncbi:MAG: hypothetical protein ACTSWN_06675 [Promethearchaeota archaeon]
MKIKLVLTTKSPKKGKTIQFKLKVPPSKQIGFINFVNAAMRGNNPVHISFEKIVGDKKEESSVQGEFYFFKEDQKQK